MLYLRISRVFSCQEYLVVHDDSGLKPKIYGKAHKCGQIVIQDKCITFKENNSMHLIGCELRSCRGHCVSAHMMQLQVYSSVPKDMLLPERTEPGFNQASVYQSLPVYRKFRR